MISPDNLLVLSEALKRLSGVVQVRGTRFLRFEGREETPGDGKLCEPVEDAALVEEAA